EPPQVAAREKVHEPEQATPLRRGEPALEGLPPDAGRRDVAAHAVDREQPERVEHPLAQVRNAEDVLDALDHDPAFPAAAFSSTSAVPPAAWILRRASALKRCALKMSLRSSSPRPSTFTPWRVFFSTPF